MKFGKHIHKKYLENLSKYPHILELHNLFDHIFFGLFGTKADNLEGDMLLRLLSSMRRSYMLGVYLFGAEQSAAGVQTMRTMIESGELICSCLIDSKSLMDLIKKNIENDSNDLKVIRDKILLNWIKDCDNQSIKETLVIHKNSKDILNSTIAHANPIHNLITGSGSSDLNFELKADLYVDGRHGQSFKEYFINISAGLNSLLILIYQISLETNTPYLQLHDISIFREIDSKLENIVA